MERIELDIPKYVYEYHEKLAKKQGMKMEKYVVEWLMGIIENDKDM